MKNFLFFCLLLHTMLVSAQSVTGSQLTTVSYKTYGYINGKRLDSVDAIYAQFKLGNSALRFDYGQSWDKLQDLNIKDGRGIDLVFINNDYGEIFALNFLYFNGWQLDRVYDGDNDKHPNIILKKIVNR